jgi:hypothetical protein
MNYFYSRNHPIDEFNGNLTLEDKIEIFRDRVQVWHFDVAMEIERQINLDHDQSRPMKHAGLSLVPMLMWYFEMVAEIRSGPSGTELKSVRFARGFEDVYPKLLKANDVKKVWRRVRNGMYHNGYMNRGTLFSGDFPAAFQVDNDGNVCVNPHRFVKTIQVHFTNLIEELNDPANSKLRTTFEEQWLIH